MEQKSKTLKVLRLVAILEGISYLLLFAITMPLKYGLDIEWPNQIKAAQKSWIGRSEGSEITFELSTGDKMPVFTTRADTLFGVTYTVIAPEHELVQSMKDSIENWDEVEKYIAETKKKSEPVAEWQEMDPHQGEARAMPYKHHDEVTQYRT